MKKLILSSVAAAALAGSVFALGAAAAPGDASPPAGHMRAMADRGFMLDAHLAGMKAALKLTPEQEKNWAPFEAAVRDAAKAQMEEMHAMREAMRGEERPSAIDHMNAMADRMAKVSANIKAIAAAAKPLFDSLDETQKHHFGPLLMTLIERGPHEGHMVGGWDKGRGEHREHGDEAK